MPVVVVVVVVERWLRCVGSGDTVDLKKAHFIKL